MILSASIIVSFCYCLTFTSGQSLLRYYLLKTAKSLCFRRIAKHYLRTSGSGSMTSHLLGKDGKRERKSELTPLGLQCA